MIIRRKERSALRKRYTFEERRKIELRHFRNKRSKWSKRYIISKRLREDIEDKSNYCETSPFFLSPLSYLSLIKTALPDILH